MAMLRTIGRREPPEPLARLERPTADEFAPYVMAAKPVVVSGAMSEWKAFHSWTPAFLEAKAGHATVPAFTLPDDQPAGRFFYGGENQFGERNMRDCLRMLRGAESRVYVAGVPIARYLPMLEEDFAVPEFLGRPKQVKTALWVSGANSSGPLHYDLDDNVHALVGGRKRFLLFDYREARGLYPNPAFSTFPHYSRVDTVDPDYARHPRFREARGYEVILDPGDMLYIPTGCWHQATTLEPSIAVTFWLGKHYFRASSLRVLVPLLLRLPVLIASELLARWRGRRGGRRGQ